MFIKVTTSSSLNQPGATFCLFVPTWAINDKKAHAARQRNNLPPGGQGGIINIGEVNSPVILVPQSFLEYTFGSDLFFLFGFYTADGNEKSGVYK